jgi:thioredoxin-dependent adenylylsulfate APS reductase
MSNSIDDKDLIETVRSGELESLDAQGILTWAIENYGSRMALSCSFGGMTGQVLIDMAYRINRKTRVLVLDTGRLPQETYELIDRVRDRYDMQVEVLVPETESLELFVRQHGMNSFYESVENRKQCCNLRKVEPLNRALAKLDAWVSGLRRDQSETRSDLRKVEIDNAHGGIVKVNPLIDWTQEQIDDYIKEFNVPVNRLHNKGYPSVGCAPCSRAIGPGDDVRAGRWWWENPDTKECGIHIGEQFDGSGI